MRRDSRVIIMGEDISGGTGTEGDQDAWGGPLGVTKGLRPEFGPERVLDTHLDEISVVGASAVAREMQLCRRGGRGGGGGREADRRTDVRRFHGRLLRPDF